MHTRVMIMKSITSPTRFNGFSNDNRMSAEMARMNSNNHVDVHMRFYSLLRRLDCAPRSIAAIANYTAASTTT